MAEIPARNPTWPNPDLHILERRAHEIVESPPRVEQDLYGVINAILTEVFHPRLPRPHMVYPQGPLRRPIQENLLQVSNSPELDFDISTQPDWESSDSDTSSNSPLDLSTHASAGD